MDFPQVFLFFFSAVGAFNAFVLGIYLLFFQRPRLLSSQMLGLLLLALSIRIGKSVCYFFDPGLPEDIRQIGLTAAWFIGPALLFYLKSLVEGIKKMPLNWQYQLLLWVGLSLCLGLGFPYRYYGDLWNHAVIHLIYFQWLCYVCISGYWVWQYYQKQEVVERKSPKTYWVVCIYLGSLFIFLAYFIVLYGAPYPAYILASLIFSFLFYLYLLSYFFRKEIRSIHLSATKYQHKKIAAPEAQAVIDRLLDLMEMPAFYRNTNLKLQDLATALGESPHFISQLLNDNLGKSFSTFVNEYRIKAAKKMIATHRHFTLEAIGQEVGFSSKSTFYAAFKKITGTTPAKFRSHL